MKNILITGATGNVGFETLHFLYHLINDVKIFAAVRNVEKAKNEFQNYPDLNIIKFDFEDFSTYENSFKNIDTVFLLRPPPISDVEKFFVPLINKIKSAGVKEILFLSVQGVEKSKVIPHNKIERLIKESGIDFIFLRPSYFMQNLTTSLLSDIRNHKKIILPAGKAKFNWIDVKNIGEAAAILLNDFDKYKNNYYELTGNENLNFYEAAEIISKTLNKKIIFENVNPVKFYFQKRKENYDNGFIVVMIMLHFLPRFQGEPRISSVYRMLTGKEPLALSEFVNREKEKFL